MRLIAYQQAAGAMIGAVEGDTVRPLAPLDAFYADIDSHRGAQGGEPILLASVTEVSPVPATARVLCIGLNYPLHIEET